MNPVFAAGLLAALSVALTAHAQEERDSQEVQEIQEINNTSGQQEDTREASQTLQDALEEHLPWWMPKGRSEPQNKLVPESGFNLHAEGGERLSLDQVVLQIRRSYDGRVVRATETRDGFVVRLLLEGGRLRTLHVSPEGEVVRAQLDE